MDLGVKNTFIINIVHKLLIPCFRLYLSESLIPGINKPRQPFFNANSSLAQLSAFVILKRFHPHEQDLLFKYWPQGETVHINRHFVGQARLSP